jgi:hypothetical protein
VNLHLHSRTADLSVGFKSAYADMGGEPEVRSLVSGFIFYSFRFRFTVSEMEVCAGGDYRV